MSSQSLSPLPDDIEALLAAERGLPAIGDEERARLRSRIETSLGVAAAATVAGVALHVATRAATASAPAGGVALATAVKLTLCAIAAVTAVGTGAVLLHRRAVTPAQVPAVAQLPLPAPLPALPPAPVAASAVVPAPVGVPEAVPHPSTVKPVVRRVAAPSLIHATPAPLEAVESPADLAAERLLLEQAHAAIVRHTPADALRACAEHARRFPSGAKAEERESLWIQALVAHGETDAAKARAVAFRRHSPRSIFLPAVDEVLRTFE